MRHHDLGALNGPVLVFGGPYSNRQALQALSDAAARYRVPAASMICTGDVVAYCGAPFETTQMMMQLGCAVVAGNCEIQLGQRAPDCGCGFDAGSTCDILSVGWYGHAAGCMNAQQKDWMAERPDVISFTHQGARYGVLHGGVRDVARFIWPTTRGEVFAQEWQALEQAIGPVDHVIAGHSGIPFVRDLPTGRWINAGVIGMPPHDGRQQTRFGILDGGEICIHRLTYDVQGAVDDMRGAGLPEGYRKGLLTGYWPSEDVLPDQLRLPSLASG